MKLNINYYSRYCLAQRPSSQWALAELVNGRDKCRTTGIYRVSNGTIYGNVFRNIIHLYL